MNQEEIQEIAKKMQKFIMSGTEKLTEKMVAHNDTTGLRLVAEALRDLAMGLQAPPDWTDLKINLN